MDVLNIPQPTIRLRRAEDRTYYWDAMEGDVQKASRACIIWARIKGPPIIIVWRNPWTLIEYAHALDFLSLDRKGRVTLMKADEAGSVKLWILVMWNSGHAFYDDANWDDSGCRQNIPGGPKACGIVQSGAPKIMQTKLVCFGGRSSVVQRIITE